MSMQEIMDIIESSLALEGIETMEGDETHLLIHDANNGMDYKITLEKKSRVSQKGDIYEKVIFRYGWHVSRLADGHL